MFLRKHEKIIAFSGIVENRYQSNLCKRGKTMGDFSLEVSIPLDKDGFIEMECDFC